MRLRTARLCLDCEEIHDAQVCPVCASETFTFLTRWVPVPEAPKQRGRATSPEAEIYRTLIDGPAEKDSGRRGRRLTQGLIGLTAVGLFGWAWRAGRAASASSRPPSRRELEPEKPGAEQD